MHHFHRSIILVVSILGSLLPAGPAAAAKLFISAPPVRAEHVYRYPSPPRPQPQPAQADRDFWTSSEAYRLMAPHPQASSGDTRMVEEPVLLDHNL